MFIFFEEKQVEALSSAKPISLSRRSVFHYLLLLASICLSACSQPQITPPSIEPVLKNYLSVLRSGEIEQMEQTYFMPLHWRHKEKMVKKFQHEHELIKLNKLTLRSLSVKQKGRWALSVIERNQEGETRIHQLWFFYYDGRWQVVSPVIFKTGPVRAMMDLYREQNDLRLWYDNERLNYNRSH